MQSFLCNGLPLQAEQETSGRGSEEDHVRSYVVIEAVFGVLGVYKLCLVFLVSSSNAWCCWYLQALITSLVFLGHVWYLQGKLYAHHVCVCASAPKGMLLKRITFTHGFINPVDSCARFWTPVHAHRGRRKHAEVKESVLHSKRMIPMVVQFAEFQKRNQPQDEEKKEEEEAADDFGPYLRKIQNLDLRCAA